MAYIENLHAPDISDLGPSLVARTARAMISRGGTSMESSNAFRLITGFLITTDKAIREYCAGRATLLDYCSNSKGLDQLQDGLGRFETCILTAKRALRFLEKLSAHPDSPKLERTLRRLSGKFGETLIPIRNTIEHIDEEIGKETQLTPGMAHLLSIDRSGEYLDISEHKISLIDLAKILRHLHLVGRELLSNLPPKI